VIKSSDSSLQKAGWILGSTAQVNALTSGGRFNGGCVSLEGVTNIKRGVTISGNTIIAQFAMRIFHLNDITTPRDFVVFYNNAGNNMCSRIRATGNGNIKAVDSTSATVATSDTGVLKDNIWQYIEVKIVVSDSGSITVKVDGVQVINATGVDTKPTTPTDIDVVAFLSTSNTSNDTFFDDIIFMDSSGSLNNNFIGDHAIKTLLPDSDDATDAAWLSQPSQSVGSEYLNIDDTVPGSDDEDSSYNYSNTPADDSLYGFESLGITPDSIPAVQLTLSAKKSDGGARTVKHLFKGDTKIAEAAFSPGSEYGLHKKIREQSADSTPVAWTAAKVNALLAGMRLES
jgi:hypothetical protein